MVNTITILNRVALMFLFLCSCIGASAQLQLNLVLQPPYSPYISDYLVYQNKALLTVINPPNSGISQIYLRGSIKGDNGVSTTTKGGYKPSVPVILTSPATVLKGHDLENAFSQGNVDIKGVEVKALLMGDGLPEGNYTVCVQAFNYTNDMPVSNNSCFMMPIRHVEPPVPTSPICNAKVSANAGQFVNFSWTLQPGAPVNTHYILKLVQLLPNQNPNDALNSITTPPFFENEITTITSYQYKLSDPVLTPGKNYAWQITAFDPNKKILFRNNGSGPVCTFTYGDLPAPTPVVTLVFPADKASMPSVNGIQANKFTFKWTYTNPTKASFLEDLVMVEVEAGQTAEEAVKKNKKVMTTNEPYQQAVFNYTGANPDGKTFAWYVTLNESGKIYKSPVRTFTIQDNKITSKQKPMEFDFGGYPVVIKFENNIKNTGGFNFSGTGSTRLYAGGPEVTVQFENITIQPFGAKRIDTEIKKASDPKKTATKRDKTKKQSPGNKQQRTDNDPYQSWKAVSGSATLSIPVKTKIKIKVPADVPGEVVFNVEKMQLRAAIKTHYNKEHNIFIQDEVYGSHGGEITGVFNWQTDYFYKQTIQGKVSEQTAVYKTASVSSKFDYTDLFDDKQVFYPTFSVGNETNIIHLSLPAGTILKLVPILSMAPKRFEAKFSFSGSCDISNPDQTKPGLNIPFSGKTGLKFTQSINNYEVVLTKDSSVKASFNNVDVNIVSGCTVNIPALSITLKQNNTIQSFSYKKASFGSKNGLYCKEKNTESSEVTMSTFPVSLSNSSVNISNSKLYELVINGTMQIPFINKKATIEFSANADGVQEGYVDLGLNSKTVLYQNLNADLCMIYPHSGVLKSDRIIVSGDISIINTKSSETNLSVKNLTMPDLYIKSNGDVGMVGYFGNAAPVPYQEEGAYNGFKFTPQYLKFERIGAKYKIGISGMVVLADNLAPEKPTGANFYTYALYDATQYKGGGPPPDQEVEIASGDVAGGCFDKVVDFKANFKYYDNDPVYGKGFRSEGEYGVKEPNAMKIHAKMMVARAPGNFNYWFIEAGQENVVQIPTGVLDLGINGFTGRVYYKMNHIGKNINKDDYMPDDTKFIGVYALTQLKTLTDNGVKFWGNVALEIVTGKNYLESIMLRGNGELISTGAGSNGMIRATDCQLNFHWAPKGLYGEFHTSANFMGSMSAEANGGLDITGEHFSVWGNGTALMFGSTDFSSGNFGFECTDKHVQFWGNYSLVDIHDTYDFVICEPGLVAKCGVWMDAKLNYSPFQVNATGDLYGSLEVDGCLVETTFLLNLKAQLMFPKPTCISAGYSFDTPLGNCSFDFGIKNGTIMFEKCF